jgi:hypothetical protein
MDESRHFVPELRVNLKVPFSTEDGASYYATWAASLIAQDLGLSKHDVKITVVDTEREVKNDQAD